MKTVILNLFWLMIFAAAVALFFTFPPVLFLYILVFEGFDHWNIQKEAGTH